ncbi:chorismate mutase [Actinomadura barringtoniae]|uniref:chorismate mutase n=1 Tax=Actinomadura barringtoniae TaxID=1427535 RepID=A0A939T1V3_9ACTN|nr:chorismate mutase [Actinomadura barringtoniae]MBO2445493.1 chorismate mutase [Actinomadura barringtoniae]
MHSLPAAAAAVAITAAPAHPVSLRPLTQVSAERVLVADKVAAAKFGTTLPIDDPAREKQLLDTVAAKSAALGIPPRTSVRIFRDQIEANKVVQRGLFARWTAHPDEAPKERPDLQKEVRPILDRITDRLLAQIKATQRTRGQASCGPRLAVAYVKISKRDQLDALHGAALLRGVSSVCGS